MDHAGETWSMFSSFMLGGCGLNDWNINSEIVRAVASDPVGPYKMVQRIAGPFVSAIFATGSVFIDDMSYGC